MNKNVNIVKNNFFPKLLILLWHLQAAVLHVLFSSKRKEFNYTFVCWWKSKSSGKLAMKGSTCLSDEFSLYNSVSLCIKIDAIAMPLAHSIRHD